MEPDDAVDVAEVFEGIYRIGLPTPYPIGPVNVYLFRDGDEFDLLDTGAPTGKSLSRLEAALVHLGVEPIRLRNIFLTHAHVDHTGALAPLLEKYDAAAFLGDADISILEARISEKFRSESDAILDRYRRIGFPASALELLPSHFMLRTFRVPPAGSVTTLHGGEMLRAGKVSLRTLAVPGHTPGSLCFYLEAERALFSGDTLLRHVTPNPGTHLYHEILVSNRFQSNPLADFLDSLGRLARLDTVVAFPGHGSSITDPGGLINDYLLHHKRRLAEILKILDRRSLTCFEISEILFGGSKDIDEMVLQNIEVLAHLMYLIWKGRMVELVSDDGLTRYLGSSGR